MTIFTKSETETEQAGEYLGKCVKGGVVALYGDLGAGKTAFVRGFMRGIGYDGRVQSPTYAIVNEYHGAVPVFHFDVYRLGGEEDLFDIGWEDYLEREGVCIVEWSEKIPKALPKDAIKVEIRKVGAEEREIEIFPYPQQERTE